MGTIACAEHVMLHRLHPMVAPQVYSYKSIAYAIHQLAVHIDARPRTALLDAARLPRSFLSHEEIRFPRYHQNGGRP